MRAVRHLLYIIRFKLLYFYLITSRMPQRGSRARSEASKAALLSVVGLPSMRNGPDEATALHGRSARSESDEASAQEKAQIGRQEARRLHWLLTMRKAGG